MERSLTSSIMIPAKQATKATIDYLGLTDAAFSLRDHAKYYVDSSLRNRNTRFKLSPAADGLPMPPPHLVYLVTSHFDCEAFYNNGILGANCIQEVLSKNGLEFSTFDRVLDFGCGCGRVIRQWRNLAGPKLYGVDYNPSSVEWCRANLTFGEFAVNTSGSPLNFPDGTFDFIYSISVFTHLTESNQHFWMGELTRTLKPGGYLLITVHGSTRLHQLTPEQRDEFEAGRVVVTHSRYSGRNLCATYHPDAYVRNVLCRDLTFVAFEPGAARDANQDIFLLRKPLR